MQLGSLQVGQHLTLNHANFRILRILEGDIFQLERQKDLALINRSKNDLLMALTNGDLCLVNAGSNSTDPPKLPICRSDIASLSADEQRQIMRRFHYVKAVEQQLATSPCATYLDDAIAIVAHRLNDESKPSTSTAYRWWRQWQKSGKNLKSLASKRRAKKLQRRFGGVVSEEILKAIEEVYLTRENHTIQAAYDELCQRLQVLNSGRTRPLVTPSRATFYRICGNCDSYTTMAARKGRAAADRFFRSTGKGADPKYILERCEVDHTPLDLIVIDDDTGRPIGRPTVTFILDRYSRMPLGFEIGFEPPSELAVMAALRNAVMPKTYLRESYPDVIHEWPAHGIPSTLVCDNGLEFHAEQLKRMCAELNIALIFCPKHQPHYKGAIERFLGTFNRQVSQRLPGTTFSNIELRGDYDPLVNARITLSDVKKLIHLWIVDIYNQSKNRITQETPYSLWTQGLLDVEPVLPESKEQLALILARETKRTLSHDGVQFKGLMYSCAELAALRIQKNGNAEVVIRFDPADLGHIWIYDDFHADYIRVLCTYQEYAVGLSLQKHLLIRKQERLNDKTLIGEDNLLKAKSKLFGLIKEMSNSKRMRDRKRAARLGVENICLPETYRETLKESCLTELNIALAITDIPLLELTHQQESRV
jgi:putative transposase